MNSDIDGTLADSDPAWPGEWLRPLIEVCVMQTIAAGPTYGYAIATELDIAGLGSLKGGTLYPLLARLERADLVHTYWGAGEGGPGRKFYELSPAGRDRLTQLVASWGAFTETVGAYLTGPDAELTTTHVTEGSR